MGTALARIIVPLDLTVVRNPDTALDHLQGPLIFGDCRMIDERNLFVEITSQLPFPGYLTVPGRNGKLTKQVMKGTDILTYFFLPALPQQSCFTHYMSVFNDWRVGSNKFKSARPCKEALVAFYSFVEALRTHVS